MGTLDRGDPKSAMLLYASPLDVAWAIRSVAIGDNRAACPYAVVIGRGVGTPAPTSRLAYPGYTGYDYGNARYMCETRPDPNAFRAGQNRGGGALIRLVDAGWTTRSFEIDLGSPYGKCYDAPIDLRDQVAGMQIVATRERTGCAVCRRAGELGAL